MIQNELGETVSEEQFNSAKNTNATISGVAGLTSGSYNHETYAGALGQAGLLNGTYIIPYERKLSKLAGFAWVLKASIAEATIIGNKDPIVAAGYRSIEVLSIPDAIAKNDIVYKVQYPSA